MLTEETINRLAEHDANLRKSFRSPVVTIVAGSLLDYGRALLNGVQDAAQAERSLCDELRERIAKARATR